NTGSDNIGIGFLAGSNATSGSVNIYIGHAGVAAESNKIRIGVQGVQNGTFIAGISGTAVVGSGVLVTGAGQLGVAASTRRVKEDIHEMGEASATLLRLRPVTFRYRLAMADGSKPLQYGLIAEEVAEVMPELVVYDEEGRPQTVQYHVLPTLLLNELQRQRVEVDQLRAQLEQQRAELAELRASGRKKVDRGICPASSTQSLESHFPAARPPLRREVGTTAFPAGIPKGEGR
ncbi:MAG: tail fiber domain-containing protein, partial [Candidatus Acidiferrales bacterium]